MLVDLLTSKGAVVGATAIGTRTGEFIVIKAKAVVMATGLFARCYNPETPLFWKYKFRYHWCPATVSGDGHATAYRAGAELANMDLPLWRYRERDDLTISHGNFPHNDGIPARQMTWDGVMLPSTARQVIIKHRIWSAWQPGDSHLPVPIPPVPCVLPPEQAL